MRGVVLRAWSWATLVVTLAASLPRSAMAEEEAAPRSVRTEATDVVLLKGGGMLRGTISELVPEDYVIIVTVTGTTRQLAMSEVTYAGPASEMPRSSGAGAPEENSADAEPDSQKGAASGQRDPKRSEIRPRVTVNGEEARVTLNSQPAESTYHLRRSSAHGFGVAARGYEELCTAPCEVTLPAGTHTFAMSRPKGPVLESEPLRVPPGDSTVLGTYTSRRGTRTAGWLILGLGIGAGMLLFYSGTLRTREECSSIGGSESCFDTPDPDGSRMLLGGLVAAGSIGLGLALGLQRDSVELRVAGQGGRHTAALRERTPRAGNGTPTLQMAGRF